MSTGLVQTIKTAAMDALDNAQIADLRYGVVTSTNPLKVRVNSQFIIPEAMLVVPQHLTNYTVMVELDWKTGGVSETEGEVAEESSVDEHTHDVIGAQQLKIYNSLNLGDRVALLRKQGGQSYFILDRL